MADGTTERGPVVLLVEDEPTTRLVLAGLLKKAGYRVVEAENGAVALTRLGSPPDTWRVDIVLTDVMMPELDGLALAKRLRELDPDLPVVFLTAYSDKELIKGALRLGVREFIEKPVDGRTLCATIEGLLRDDAQPGHRGEMHETVAAVRNIQRVLASPEQNTWPIYAHLAPCHPAGGDIFRVFERTDGGCVFVLADVAGHSVESSYAVASFLGALSAWGIDTDDYAALLREVNQAVARGPFGDAAVCALLGWWDVGTGRLELFNAGLPHPWIYRRRMARAEPLLMNGTPLGLFDAPSVDRRILLLETGDRVVLGSDGLFDAMGGGGTRFEHSIGSLCGAWARHSAERLPEALCRMGRGRLSAPQSDDMLAVVLEQPARLTAHDRCVLTLSSTYPDIDQACNSLEKFLEGQAMPLEAGARFEVVAAAREALLNAVIHGNEGARERPLGMLARHDSGACRVVVAVFDQGNGFAPDAARANADALREGHRGLALMQGFALRVTSAPGETCLEFGY